MSTIEKLKLRPGDRFRAFDARGVGLKTQGCEKELPQ